MFSFFLTNHNIEIMIRWWPKFWELGTPLGRCPKDRELEASVGLGLKYWESGVWGTKIRNSFKQGSKYFELGTLFRLWNKKWGIGASLGQY